MFYDYECKHCGNSREVEHSIRETPVVVCDKCSKDMHRVISSGTRFALIGHGWARTGYVKPGDVVK